MPETPTEFTPEMPIEIFIPCLVLVIVVQISTYRMIKHWSKQGQMKKNAAMQGLGISTVGFGGLMWILFKGYVVI